MLNFHRLAGGSCLTKTTFSPTTASAQAARKSHSLIVPNEVLNLPGVTLTAKLVLAEALDLYKVNHWVSPATSIFRRARLVGVRPVSNVIR